MSNTDTPCPGCGQHIDPSCVCICAAPVDRFKLRMVVIESVHGGWNYAPADAPASFLRCLKYDDSGYPSLEKAILAAEQDKSIPASCRPLHYTPQFVKTTTE